jgi:signal transduction histidine kinase
VFLSVFFPGTVLLMTAAQALPRQDFRSESIETDFRSIFEHLPLPIARCDQHGIILQMNPAFEQVLAGKKTRGGTLQIGDVVASDDRRGNDGEAENRAPIDRMLREVVEGLRPAVHLGETGSSRGWTMWRVGSIGSHSEQVFLMAGPCGEEVVAHHHALQAQRWESVGRLTGGVVHDFNNLLTGVMLYCDLLLGSLESGERRPRRYAEEIRAAVWQATTMVRQLLALARPKSGSVRPICLNHVAETMRNLISRLIGEHIQLEFQLQPRLGLVEIDWGQAEQVLLNLILNARDALPVGGRISVETSNCKFEHVRESGIFAAVPALSYVMVSVSDNGSGMDAETRERLFEPFYTTKTAGTGLGFTTVRSIVTNNRGLIHVKSHPGLGTRVTVLLPQSSPNSVSAYLATSSKPHTTLREVTKEPQL